MNRPIAKSEIAKLSALIARLESWQVRNDKHDNMLLARQAKGTLIRLLSELERSRS